MTTAALPVFAPRCDAHRSLEKAKPPMTLPKFSIVTTSYNQGRYLEKCIRSVIEQNYPNLEYIIIDGGSTDDSVSIIRKYERHLAWWVSEKDRGQPHALNKGFNRATGDVFGFINSDDSLEPGALEFASSCFLRGEKWIVGWVRFIEEGGGDFPQVWQDYQRVGDWFITNPLPQQGTFWHSSLWKQHGGFREDLQLVFDYEFWMRLRFVAKVRPTMVRRCLGTYRLHASSKTCSQTGQYGPENEAVRREYMKLLSPDELRDAKARRRKRAIDRHRLAGWQALKELNLPEARRHAVETIKRDAFASDAWRLLLCALRGK
jgi:glycosyltransferase involved in cell wall biosynthesis